METKSSVPKKHESVTKVNLTPAFTVGARSFASFDLWMTGELRKLVSQWQHLAAPCDLAEWADTDLNLQRSK